MTQNLVTKVRTPLFPLYSEVRQLMQILEGVNKSDVTTMIRNIFAQTGTPQNPVDWSEPETWIDERLDGSDAEIAGRIWNRSGNKINPRHIYGSYLFINGHDLMAADAAGLYRLTERGRSFLADEPRTLRAIDDLEGLRQLLGILGTKSRAKRADLIPEWGDFLREYSNYGTESTIKDTLRRRILNLIERGFVSREGNVYSITASGIEYATPVSGPEPIQADPRRAVNVAIQNYNAAQTLRLRELLGKMNPYQFEHLVRDLLEAMGYEDVIVTKESGDKGVDIVATVQFGITTIVEVVQVKRHQGTITRPTIDQLRGALPYHNAIRGTIITTGTFSSGCAEAALFLGAAPISLIDGNRLLELLVEHEIGIRKRPATLYEIDSELFLTSHEQQEIDEALAEAE